MIRVYRSQHHRLCLFALICTIFFGAMMLMPQKSYACFPSCNSMVKSWRSSIWYQARDKFDTRIDSKFMELEEFVARDMWGQSILPAMMLMAEQFTVVALQQAMIIGTFFDAENHLNAQLALQEIQAKIHKKYQPSVGLCEFGSLMKSLAASERRGELTAFALSQRSQDRQLGNADSIGAYGHELDKLYRIYQFKNVFCNEKDRGSALANICTSDVAWSEDEFDADARKLINQDIDFVSLLERSNTVNADFTNGEILVEAENTGDPEIRNEGDQSILAMASNLYGHDGFARVPPKLLTDKPEERGITPVQEAYMDMRALVAKRSVAENSFNAIAGMKSEGISTEDPDNENEFFDMHAKKYLRAILKDLGITDEDALDAELGKNPSYLSQMEVLTKKVYQNPNFYTNLYDTPANIERKAVAVQAIKLMQKFDMLKSFLRNEASVSILLEFAVEDLQKEVENQILVFNE